MSGESGPGAKDDAGWGEEDVPRGRVRIDDGSLGKVKQSQEWRWQGVDPARA